MADVTPSPTFTGNRGLMIEEPLIFEQGEPERTQGELSCALRDVTRDRTEKIGMDGRLQARHDHGPESPEQQ